jgi:hypothetical protein
MHMGVVTIQGTKKGIRLQRKIVKIEKIFRFYYLKP